MRGALIAIGTLLIIVAMVFLIWGMVEVAQGDKGTWQIWPFYVIHGGIALAGMVLYAVANRGRVQAVSAEAGEVEET